MRLPLRIFRQKPEPKSPTHRWVFEPPSYVGIKHATPKKLEHIRQVSALNIGKMAPMSGEDLGRIHPLVKENLPKDPNGLHLRGEILKLRGARDLLKMGIKGMRFMDAKVDASTVFTASDPSGGEVTVTFNHPQLPPKKSLTFIAYITRLPNREYLVDAFGMQHSTPREQLPKGLHRLHDEAPMLGLALVNEALMREGARRIYMPGVGYEEHRKGFKSEAVRGKLERIMGGSEANLYPAKTQAMVRAMLRNWHRLTDEDVHSRLSGIQGLDTLGFPPNLIRRYYGEYLGRLQSDRVLMESPHDAGSGRKFDFYVLDPQQFEPIRRFLKPHQPA